MTKKSELSCEYPNARIKKAANTRHRPIIANFSLKDRKTIHDKRNEFTTMNTTETARAIFCH